MTVTSHRLTDDYLRRLDRAARVLPRREREELAAEVRSHLDAGLTPGANEADVRNLLDDLGPPEDIVAAARPDEVPVRRGAREAFALILLVVGLPPPFGWLVGLGLLLWSPLWSTRQKLLGALVWPGGYAGVLMFLLIFPVLARSSGGVCSTTSAGVSTVCRTTSTSGPPVVVGAAVEILLIVAPLVVAAYLYRAAGKRARTV